MNEYDTALLQRQLHELADDSRPPHGLAGAAVGQARRIRRRQVTGAAAAVLALGLGLGGLGSALSGRPAPGPGGRPMPTGFTLSVPPAPSGPKQPTSSRPLGEVLGRMPHAVAVVWRGGVGYGVDAAGRETALVRFGFMPTGSAVLSPDGTRLAIPGSALDDYRTVGLWVLDLASGRARVLPARGDQLMSVFWSPDGGSVLTQRYGGGQTYVIDVASGKVQQVAGGFTADVYGWAPDGRILAAQTVPDAGASATGAERHVWFWLDLATGTQQRIPGLDGWSGLGDQGGLPDPSATATAPTDPPATLSGWGTAGLPSPDGTLLPFERPTPDGRTELTVVDLGTGRRVQTWLLTASDGSGQWTAWLDDGTLLAAEHPPGAALTVDRLSVTTGARDTWRSFTGADAVSTASTLTGG